MKKQIIFVFLSLAVILPLLGCWAWIDKPTERVRESGDVPIFYYEIIYLEGMPCLYVERRISGGFSAPAITCDWSEWKGDD